MEELSFIYWKDITLKELIQSLVGLYPTDAGSQLLLLAAGHFNLEYS